MTHSITPRLAASLLAIAAAASPALALAQSNVTVYGIVDVTVRHATNAVAGGGSQGSVADGAYTGSRFGFRGTEDLGGGMKAMFSLEGGFDPSTGSLQQATASGNNGQAAAPVGRFFDRESWVGLSNAYGQITLGRQYTIAHPLSGRFQPQPNPNLDALSVFSGHHVSRQDNMLRYTGQFGAVGLYASYTASEGNGKGHGLGATYTANGLDVVAYYQTIGNAAGTVTRRITGVGGNYAVTPDLKAYLGYMKRDASGNAQENDVWTVGLNYNVTPLLVFTASWVQDKQSGVSAGKREVAYLGLDYFLSKRTDIYTLVDNNRLSGSYPIPSFMGSRDAANGATVGVRHRF